MGFGTLFVGWLTLFYFRSVDIFPDIIAYIVMLVGMKKISSHSEYFRTAMYTVYALIAVGLVGDIMQITAAVTDISFGMAQSIVSIVSGVVLLAFTYLLCRAIMMLAGELELTKLVSKARLNIVLAVIYCVLTAVSLCMPAGAKFTAYIAMSGIILGIVWMLHGAVMIYGCYRYICLEGDEEMETENPGKLVRLIFKNEKKPIQTDEAKPRKKKKSKHK